jgi:hypothetical protein
VWEEKWRDLLNMCGVGLAICGVELITKPGKICTLGSRYLLQLNGAVVSVACTRVQEFNSLPGHFFFPYLK